MPRAPACQRPHHKGAHYMRTSGGSMCCHGWVQTCVNDVVARCLVIRKYATSPSYIEQVRPKLAHLEETMRALPGFVAYHFVETGDGITTITITEDDRGTAESMGRAKTWMEENPPEDLPGAPEVIQGHTLLSFTR